MAPVAACPHATARTIGIALGSGIPPFRIFRSIKRETIANKLFPRSVPPEQVATLRPYWSGGESHQHKEPHQFRTRNDRTETQQAR
jgi:hypothetical protein